jgi:hypothetical protein
MISIPIRSLDYGVCPCGCFRTLAANTWGNTWDDGTPRLQLAIRDPPQRPDFFPFDTPNSHLNTSPKIFAACARKYQYNGLA